MFKGHYPTRKHAVHILQDIIYAKCFHMGETRSTFRLPHSTPQLKYVPTPMHFPKLV